jgi:hypothetical protein
MNIRVNAATWRAFVEKCRNDSLDELRSIVEKVTSLRSTFEQDNNVGSSPEFDDRVLTHSCSASASLTSFWVPLRQLGSCSPIRRP